MISHGWVTSSTARSCAGASYVFSDYPTNWYESWDFKAEALGPTVWQVDNHTFDGPGDVYFMTIID